MKRLIGILALALVLVGCASPIDHGIITAKVYEPSYDYWTQVCVSYNKDMLCKQYMPQYHHVPESFKFELVDFDDAEKTGWAYVNENTYNSYEKGQMYP